MIVDVLVDAVVQPWQRIVADRLREKHEIRLHAVAYGEHRRRRPLVVALYARVDRWPSATRAPEVNLTSLGETVGSANLILDLTERHAAQDASSAPILRPRPAQLDERALLERLVRREPTMDLEVVNATGDVVAASTIQLVRLSARRSSARAAHRVAALLERALEGHGGGERIEHRPAPRRGGVSTFSVFRLLAAAVHAAIRVATTRPAWRVTVGTASSDDLLALPAERRPVDAPSGHWYADPFVAETDSGAYLFVEDFDVGLGRASLAVLDLHTREATTVLSAEHHLSYPHVFEVDGDWYMIPEEAEAHQVALYRCDEFPREWSLDTVLLDSIVAFDSTPLQHDGLWWLFFASGTPGAAEDDELHVWFSDDLRGPYRPHPSNPVRSTPVGARPAGRIVERGGRLLRPGQDGSREYGGSIVMHEIVRLSTNEYEERVVGRVDPSAMGARGIHTINRAGELVAVDTKHAVAKTPRR